MLSRMNKLRKKIENFALGLLENGKETLVASAEVLESFSCRNFISSP